MSKVRVASINGATITTREALDINAGDEIVLHRGLPDLPWWRCFGPLFHHWSRWDIWMVRDEWDRPAQRRSCADCGLVQQRSL